MDLTKEQQQILDSNEKRVVVSASAGSGKTFVLIEKLISLICDKKVPVERLLVLTFTKAAAKEMKSRLLVSMLSQKPSDYLLQQIDDLSISDISTIDSFCEKIIKRNINKLDIDEGFTILDERGITSLKNRAFQSAFERFSNSAEEFNQIYFAFKKNKDRLAQCIFDMQSFFDSIANEGDARGDFLDNFEAYQEKAKEYLKGVIGDKIKRAKTCLEEARCYLEPPQKGEEFVQAVLSQLNSFSVSEGFYPLCRQISGVLLPDLPRVKMDGEYKKLLAKAKELVKEAQSLTDQYSQLSEEEVRELERGDLSKVLIKFYNLYQERYSILKARRGVLDFADIERYAHKLLQYEDIKKALQDKYDYIFIDEYQDTNRLQESILKPIAEGGYFTAVGDIKQGIYGFRNASKEIMLQDIADFDASEDGQALYLTGNFRTDDRILSFVNDIFEKIMTVESCGIDYKDKSKLVGLQTFEKNGLCPVSVDIVCGEEVEKEPATGVYSVREDIVKEDDKFSLELACIEGRINEVLATKLYDAKNKVFRDARQSDIALLFRSRSPLMKECVKHLQAKGFAVDADIKNSLLEDGQIRVIASLLKLSINIEDDISLASVMASAIGGFSLQELSDLRSEQREEDFWQIVLNSKSEKIENFLGKIKDFTFDCQVFGITKALQKIF
ncbi:MAG: UvrD-helicase domain-containing protein, partial [Clostridia bacterium]|nr:UvrD-helicase domain-containing protein [Clostridia bacterium]